MNTTTKNIPSNIKAAIALNAIVELETLGYIGSVPSIELTEHVVKRALVRAGYVPFASILGPMVDDVRAELSPMARD